MNSLVFLSLLLLLQVVHSQPLVISDFALSYSLNPTCPTSILHNPPLQDNSLLHSAIDTCSSTSSLTLSDSPSLVKSLLRTQGAIDLVDIYVRLVPPPLLFGVETETRVCQQYNLAPGSLLIFFTPEERLVVAGISFKKDVPVMLIFDPDPEQGLCLYEAQKVVKPTVTPMPGEGNPGATQQPNTETTPSTGDTGGAAGETGASDGLTDGGSEQTASETGQTEQGAEGTEEGADGTEEGAEGTEEGAEGTEEGAEGTEEGAEGTEEGAEGTEEGAEGTEEGAEGTEEGAEGTEEGAEGTEEGAEGTEEGAEGTEEGAEGTEEGAEGTEEGAEGTEEGAEGTEEGAEGTEEGAEGTEEGAEGTEEGAEGTEEGAEGTEEGAEGSEEGAEGSEEGAEGTEEGAEGTEEGAEETEEGAEGTDEGAEGTEEGAEGTEEGAEGTEEGAEETEEGAEGTEEGSEGTPGSGDIGSEEPTESGVDQGDETAEPSGPPQEDDDGPTPLETDDGDGNNATGDGEDDGSVCFPGDGRVKMRNGKWKRMSEVQVGDWVEVSGGFSEVLMFTHKLEDTKYRFVELTVDGGETVRATSGHYAYVNRELKRMGSVLVGDMVEDVEGRMKRVVQVREVSGLGLFNPQTRSGDIIVDGVRMSTYTTTVEIGVAQGLLAPVRWMWEWGIRIEMFEKGGMGIERLLPGGSEIVRLV